MEGGGRQEHVFGLKQDDPVAYDERRKEQYRRSDAKKKAKKKAKKEAKAARDRDAAQVRAAREETARVRAAHTRDAAHADAMEDHINAILRVKKAQERMRELQHVETEQELADMGGTVLPSSDSSNSESSSDSESEQPATIMQPKMQKRRKESERKELTYMYGREQTHNQPGAPGAGVLPIDRGACSQRDQPGDPDRVPCQRPGVPQTDVGSARRARPAGPLRNLSRPVDGQ
jgi:hypothetical protein